MRLQYLQNMKEKMLGRIQKERGKERKELRKRASKQMFLLIFCTVSPPSSLSTMFHMLLLLTSLLPSTMNVGLT